MHLSPAPAKGKSKIPRHAAALALCVGCIFLGSAAENIMTNWISSYVENALHLPKMVADILGLALFAVLLALTRTYYAKKGKNIINFLTMGMAGAVICYLTAGLCPVPLISMLACVLTGIFTAMLWPGTLIMMEENIPHVSVAAYALMAAGGDFGASAAPQLMGVIVDTVAQSRWAADICRTLSLTPDQLGMKVGMLIAAIFPVLGVLLLLYIKRYFKKQKETI
jgi:MFS family permease